MDANSLLLAKAALKIIESSDTMKRMFPDPASFLTEEDKTERFELTPELLKSFIPAKIYEDCSESNKINGMCFSREGDLLVTSSDAKLSVYDCERGR